MFASTIRLSVRRDPRTTWSHTATSASVPPFTNPATQKRGTGSQGRTGDDADKKMKVKKAVIRPLKIIHGWIIHSGGGRRRPKLPQQLTHTAAALKQVKHFVLAD